ncbi:MOSC domain-containing protein [Oryzibacter oryziterrae]|uniref:MOSC domain-containing protein n=1 Tax=Oryzibacter oryziterrae TaxID=2766474 RepID=UPI001F3BBF2C|nr:MOSC domain-containing protein [Oryzibacter oryziterrae]
MRLTALCIADGRVPAGRADGSTGICKAPVGTTAILGPLGLEGDRIVNRRYHGGPDQAVYLECEDDIAWWQDELDLPLPAGAFGENLRISGIGNRDIAAGDRLVIGDVVLEATAPRIPCSTFAALMGDPTFVKHYTAAARPGVYFRVLQPGKLILESEVTYHPHQGERIAMPELMAVYLKRPDRERVGRYLAVPIAERLRAHLSRDN